MHIRDVHAIKQAADFSGLEFGGGKRPTDVDCFYEEAANLFVFVELKYKEHAKEFRTESCYKGQRLALTRLVDAIDPSYNAVLFVASHDAQTGQLIAAATSQVVDVYYEGRWRVLKPDDEGQTLKALFDRFRDKYAKVQRICVK